MTLRAAGGGSGYTPGGTDVAVADGGTGASTAAGARTNLGITYQPINSLPFNARADSTTSLTNMAAAANFFPLNSKRAISKSDLTNYTQCRLITNVVTGATVAGKIVLKYKTSLTYATDAATDFSDIGTSEVSCSVIAAGLIDSGWINLAAGAKADVFIVPVTIDGTGAATPGVGSVYAEFR